jgi:glycerol-3-phosphate O-acyltransferase
MPFVMSLRVWVYRAMLAALKLLLRFAPVTTPPQPEPTQQWIYVFGRHSLADRLAADCFLARHQLPTLSASGATQPFIEVVHTEVNPELTAQVDAWQTHQLNPHWVPITVLWGRSDTAHGKRLGELFADRWAHMGRVRTVLMVLFNLRHCQVVVSPPIALANATPGQEETALLSRKIQRVLRVHFMRVRQQALGPDLSDRKSVV